MAGAGVRDASDHPLLASAELYTPVAVTPPPVLFSTAGDGQGQGAILHANTARLATPNDPASAVQPAGAKWLKVASANIERQELPDAEQKNIHLFGTPYLQQPGAQQEAFGFVARTKALMNFPSTCGAMAFTSIPSAVRKVRASSML